MIRFSLRCDREHEFEGWFRNGESFEDAIKEVCCPECGSNKVEKAIMAPSIGKNSESDVPISPAQLRAALVELRRQVEEHCDYVGTQFAEEARRIHYGETDPHGIYGKATNDEARELAEEGIHIGRIPVLTPKN